MPKPEINDTIAFIREVAAHPLWEVSYHEEMLPLAYKKLRFAKEMIERGGFDLDGARAEVTGEDEDANENFENVEQFVLSIYDDAADAVDYHEKSLALAHNHLACAKIMLERGNYTEIDFDEVIKEQEEKREKRKKKA
jgi:hypothetical protein